MAQNEPQRKEMPPGPSPTHHHYYLNISVEAANLSDWRIEKIDLIEWKLFARIGML